MTTPSHAVATAAAVVVSLLATTGAARAQTAAAGPYVRASGVKIVEVGPLSAFVWARVSRVAERVADDGPQPVVRYADPKTGALDKRMRRPWRPVVEFGAAGSVDGLAGAVPGAAGFVVVRYRPAGAAEDAWRSTAPQAVDPDADWTALVPLRGLMPGTRYELDITAHGAADGPVSDRQPASFTTAPRAEDPARVRFTVSTGQMYRDRDGPQGFDLYDGMLKVEPDLFIHTGDVVYYDRLAKSPALARWHWQRTYSSPTNRRFHARVASHFMKDDHDVLINDCWPGQAPKCMGSLTFPIGQRIFREQTGLPAVPFRRARWGKDLELWLVEGRDYRSPNNAPDGPEKTIWGRAQFDWLRATMTASDATFRVLVSPTPIVGPDRKNKRDNHCNDAFAHEGERVRAFLASVPGAFVVCGDRHWQYVSVDPATELREFSCGPASNRHAGGWKRDDQRPEHRYLNVTGGFLAVTVERDGDGKPVAICTHHGPDGAELHATRVTR